MGWVCVLKGAAVVVGVAPKSPPEGAGAGVPNKPPDGAGVLPNRPPEGAGAVCIICVTVEQILW